MKKFVCLLLPCFSLMAIEGTYKVNGYDPYFKMSYSGTVIITKDQNEVYQASWTITEGDKEYKDIGTGIKLGDTVSFVFKSAPGQQTKDEGVQVYKIGKESLEGPFVLLGQNLAGKEKLQKS